MSESDTAARDELALELFIGDNSNQPRDASIADWEYFQDSNNFQGRVEHYEMMAAHILAIGYRYAPHIVCPDCGDHVLVDHSLTITTGPSGAQELVSDPDLGPLWVHWGTHLGIESTK